MGLPALVLVHGGGCAGDCWQLTVDEIHRLAPELTVLAVDLPGRCGKPGDLMALTVADFVDSAVGDIEDARLDEVVVVGHSMGGLTVPGMAAKLGASRVREMIFAAAFVPPEGKALADTLTGVFAGTARRRAASVKRPGPMPAWQARLAFMNGTSSAQRQFMRGKLYSESPPVLAEVISRADMPDEVPRTWILTLRDRALSVESQRRSIEALGGVHTVIEANTCHMLMVSEPEWLAQRLIERCRLYGR